MASTPTQAPGSVEGGSRGLYLQWEGKRLYRQQVPTPRILEPLDKYSFGNNRENLLIEGDNLQVLASLKPRYGGQVDVVYIDPPYNLGKDDFRYSDRRFHDPDADDSDAVYVSNEDGGRHTKWLNFIAPRIYLLWQLLHDERGVIFVSINDVELFRLGMLLNEIFGEHNHIGTIVWKGATDNNPTRIAIEHEYVLCYAKNKAALPPVWSGKENEAKALMLKSHSQIKAESSTIAQVKKKFATFAKDNKEFLGDLYRYRQVDAHGPYVARRNLDNPGKPGNMDDFPHPNGKPVRKPVWGWRYSTKRLEELNRDKRLIFGKDETKIPELKVYLDEVEFPFRSVISLDARAGSNTLEELFGRRDMFKNPKPVELIERLLDFTTRPDSLVLDAFAGSGTTGESVMRLNAKDGGNRRFILIEEGEGKDKFCRALTAKRLRLAIEKLGFDREGFQFMKSGQKLDRRAILGLERDALASLICQADETGRGRGISALSGYKYIIGKNSRAEAICLLWNGINGSEVTAKDLQEASKEVTAAGLKRPFRMYGTFCRIGDTASWKFCQIPDEIIAQMNIDEEMTEGEAACLP